MWHLWSNIRERCVDMHICMCSLYVYSPYLHLSLIVVPYLRGLYQWREEIITYKCTSHSFNVFNKLKRTSYKFCGHFHLAWLELDKFRVFDANSNAKPTNYNNIWVAFYFMTICWMNRISLSLSYGSLKPQRIDVTTTTFISALQCLHPLLWVGKKHSMGRIYHRPHDSMDIANTNVIHLLILRIFSHPTIFHVLCKMDDFTF